MCVESECAKDNAKPIVPVLVEDSYQPDGWLGELCAGTGRECIELYDPQKFDEKMTELEHEVRIARWSQPG